MDSEDKAIVTIWVSVVLMICVGFVSRAYVASCGLQKRGQEFPDAEFSYGENKSPCIRVMKDGEVREIDLWKLSEGQYDNAERTN